MRRTLSLMNYLEMCCLISKYLRIYHIYLLLIFLFNSVLVRKHSLYDLNPLEFINTFMVQIIVYLGKCPTHTWKKCILLLLGGLCQLGKISSVFHIFPNLAGFLSMCSFIIEKEELELPTAIVDLSLSPFSCIFFTLFWMFSIMCLHI